MEPKDDTRADDRPPGLTKGQTTAAAPAAPTAAATAAANEIPEAGDGPQTGDLDPPPIFGDTADLRSPAPPPPEEGGERAQDRARRRSRSPALVRDSSRPPPGRVSARLLALQAGSTLSPASGSGSRAVRTAVDAAVAQATETTAAQRITARAVYEDRRAKGLPFGQTAGYDPSPIIRDQKVRLLRGPGSHGGGRRRGGSRSPPPSDQQPGPGAVNEPASTALAMAAAADAAEAMAQAEIPGPPEPPPPAPDGPPESRHRLDEMD